VNVDGTEHPVTYAAEGLDGSIVFAIKDGAAASLSVAERPSVSADEDADPIEQSYDLRAGKVGDPIAVYYRNRVADKIKKVDIPCAWTELGEYNGTADAQGDCIERLVISDVHLAYAFDNGSESASINSDYIKADSRKDALLVVETNQHSVKLELPDGTIEESEVQYEEPGYGDYWVFKVPGDFTGGNLLTVSLVDSPDAPSGGGLSSVGVEHAEAFQVPR